MVSEALLVGSKDIVILLNQTSQCRERWFSSFLLTLVDVGLLSIFCWLFNAKGHCSRPKRYMGPKPSLSSTSQRGHLWTVSASHCVCDLVCYSSSPPAFTARATLPPRCPSKDSTPASGLLLWLLSLLGKLCPISLFTSFPKCHLLNDHPVNNYNSQYSPTPHPMLSRGTVIFVCFVCWSLPSA